VSRKDFFWKLAYLGASLAVFMVDQVTKAWAIRKLRFGGDRTIIDGLLNFVYAENTGVAFSQLQDGGDFGRYALSGLALLAAVFVMYYFWRVNRTNDRLLGALALLFAGILGNVTDRLRLGFVIDWIQVHYQDWYYPVFNIADSAICIGAFLLIIDMFFSKKAEEETTDKKE
jgi:signal peptidase II